MPNSSNESSRTSMLSPYLPTSTPASTMPMMCGMRSLPMMMGAERMIIITTKNMSVGSVIGKYCAIWDMGILLMLSVYYLINVQT